ncbi:MAG TPA: methyltransferase domain-containing protein [Candidatus Dojkabacteria bacterium]|nr:methyltransferase domain-containing protein [Candidatus Dojkabacteria bacterium]
MPPTNIKLPEKPNDQTPAKQDNDDKLIKNITFFGDSAFPEDDPYYKAAWETAKYLAENGYTIVNGGGPGIMKAATDGAESINGNTIAIYWQPKLASFFEGRNLANVTDESETASNYLIRTLGLIENGDAYIVFKGGTGTISEFGMVWCLAKLYYGSHKPVILYGDFWDQIIECVQKNMAIDEIELSVLYQANDPKQVLGILKDHEEKLSHIKKDRKKEFSSDEQGFILGGDSDVVEKTFKAYNAIASDYHSSHAGKLTAQDQLDEFISMVNPPAQVLDIGSGPGHDAGYLSSKYSVTGIEISRRFYEIAKFENPNVNFIHGDITKFDPGKEKYKGIWARDALHHIQQKDLANVFTKLSNALVEDGILYLLVREGEGEIIEEERTEYATTEKFFHLFTEEELRTRTEEVGLKVVSIKHTKRSHKWLVGIFRK